MEDSSFKFAIVKTQYITLSWLYAYERNWLNSMLPSPTKSTFRSKVNWNKRDIELVPKVRKLMHQHKGRISRTQLEKKLGGHGWLTRMQHKLPLTLNTFYELQKLLPNLIIEK